MVYIPVSEQKSILWNQLGGGGGKKKKYKIQKVGGKNREFFP